MASPSEMVWWRHQLRPIGSSALPAATEAWQGRGLFETIRAHHGRPLLVDRHQSRLETSARAFEIPLPAAARPLSTPLVALLEANGHINGWLRTILVESSDPGDEPLLFIRSFPDLPYDPGELARGVSLIPARFRRDAQDPLVGHKTLSGWGLVQERKHAQHLGHFDALLQNTEGFLTEGCATNLFLVHEGVLRTPPCRDGLLPGVTRSKVLELADTLDIEVWETSIRPDVLSEADECFLTNALAGIIPVGAPGPLTRRIGSAYRESVLSP